MALVVMSLVTAMSPTSASAAIKDADAVYKAMKKELTRNKQQLALDDFDKPYFISYRLVDTESYLLTAFEGSLFTDDHRNDRHVHVEVRVGDYAFDNTGSSKDIDYFDFDFSIKYVPMDMAPVDDDPQALELVLWLLTDAKYKQALAVYNKLKGKKVFQPDDEDGADSFSKTKPVKAKAPLHALEVDIEAWKKVVIELSAMFEEHPAIFDSGVVFRITRVQKIFLNTEGTEVVTEGTYVTVQAKGNAWAKDGMLVTHSVEFYERSEDAMPSLDEMKAGVATMIDQLLALKDAPMFTPYVGPTILKADAAGVFFHETIGHRMEGHRQEKEDEGQTFKDKIGKSIIPAFLDLIDDPTKKSFQGVTLFGHYDFDDEGVPAQETILVDDGVLKGFLMGRRPIKGFPSSNGHGRAEGANTPTSRMGNLMLLSSKTVPYDTLKAQLIAEVKKQKKPFGIIVHSLTGGSTNTSGYGFQAYKGLSKLVYKVDAETGEETLVRGVEIVGTPLTSINKILAVSDDYAVFNGFCGAESGYVPVSAIAPSILFQEMELQRSMQSKQRGQLLPSPLEVEK